MPHIRAFFTSNEWLTAGDLYDEKRDEYFDVDCEITKVTKGSLATPGKSDQKKGRPVLHLRSLRNGKDLPKPFAIGATITDTIGELVGSFEAKRWVGQAITLFVTETKVGRGMRPCIRVKPQAPQVQQRGGQGSGQQSRPADPPRDQSAPVTDTSRGYQGDPPDLTDDEKREIADLERKGAS